ncbi:hypothetical protein [Halospeciosus flavus]|uniref:Transcriptional regulator n=1 Tax=Halospeciosus flavus TaxID=3032283 RepID=A0ABD5YWH6_9EURY|nr:hypothetical protein [Halospeciosus flavus]
MLDSLEEEVDMFSRHLEILQLVIENGPIGIVKLSNETGHPHHKVRYSLRILEEEELIEATSQGAVATDQAEEFVAETNERLEEIVEKLESLKIEPEAVE